MRAPLGGKRVLDCATFIAGPTWQKLGPMSKQGGRYSLRILVVGAHAVLRRTRQQSEKYPRLTQLLARKMCMLKMLASLVLFRAAAMKPATAPSALKIQAILGERFHSAGI